MDIVDKGTVVAIVIAFSSPFIAAPELAANDIFVIAAAAVAGLGVVGKVIKDVLTH